MKRLVSLNPKSATYCVTRSRGCINAVLNLHRYAFSLAGIRWADVPPLPDHAECCPETAKALFRLFIERETADNRTRPPNRQVMPGGAWLNYGFSTDPSLKPWQVRLPV